jgi:outer membrane protein assembly factor BamE (lipoprotein component of BamABCDE complex)
MKRKLKWLAIVLAVLLLGFGTVLFLWPRDRITPELWEKIEIGMTENQVEEILGGPGMSWKQFKEPHFFYRMVLSEPKGYRVQVRGMQMLDECKYWPSERRCLQIGFDGTGEVDGKVLWESGQRQPSFIDRLRDWLGW